MLLAESYVLYLDEIVRGTGLNSGSYYENCHPESGTRTRMSKPTLKSQSIGQAQERRISLSLHTYTVSISQP